MQVAQLPDKGTFKRPRKYATFVARSVPIIEDR